MKERKALTKQDEKQRLRRRLQDYAITLATQNQWAQSVEVNQQILTIEEDSPTYNRLGKAYIEQGMYDKAYEAYEHSFEISPTNAIARKNLTRIEALMARGIERDTEKKPRQQIDTRMFITEAGKTVITSLVDVPRCPAVEMLTTSEIVQMVEDNHQIKIVDADGNVLGAIEPKLGQRLKELFKLGNRYVAAITQCDTRQVQILIRETHQHPEQRGMISFPNKMSNTMAYVPGQRYEYDAEELMEEEDVIEEPEDIDDDYAGSDEEEIGLDELDKDIPDDDENEE